MLSFFYHFFLYIELVKPDSRAGARLLWRPYFLSAECAYPIKRGTRSCPVGFFCNRNTFLLQKKAPPLVRDEAEVRGTTLIPAQNVQALGIRNVYERHDLPAVFVGRFLPCCFSGKFKRLSELEGAYSR